MSYYKCCYTDTEQKTFTYKWVIKRFSTRPEQPSQYIESSIFKSDDIGNQTWCLILYPNGYDASYQSYLSITLNQITGDAANVQFALKCTNNEGMEHSRQTNFKFRPGSKKGFRKFLNRDKLVNMLHNNELTILCTLSTLKDVRYDLQFEIPECHISEEFGQLLINEDFSDVILSVQGHDFKAHKAILAARSPVFAAMFKHDMQEANTNCVQIPDSDPEAFRELLQFIYTGKKSNVKAFPDRLLKLSDKYGLERLKSMCEVELVRQLTVENSADTLALSDLHGSQQLKSETVTFIISHYNDVKKTSGWKSMPLNSTVQLLIDKAVGLSTTESPTKKLKR